VALLDESGAVIPGFSLEDCREIRGDSVDMPVQWEGKGANLSKLAGRVVKLQLELRDADLYAFQFSSIK
jgi:hypothetical protein